MGQMESIEITLREALPSDASEILTYFNAVAEESDFLVAESLEDVLPEAFAEKIASRLASPNQLILLAFHEATLVGLAEVQASQHPAIAHIGECSLSVREAFNGFGIGQTLLNEVLVWAETTGRMYRLELTVQERNKKAIHIYRKVGFVTEATMARGARNQEGELIDVLLMRLLIDPPKNT